MIYRFHVFEADNQDRVRTTYSDNALAMTLSDLPQQLNWLLGEAEVLNEILDLDKQEAYLKVTTNLERQSVVSRIHDKLSLSGLTSTLLNQ